MPVAHVAGRAVSVLEALVSLRHPPLTSRKRIVPRSGAQERDPVLRSRGERRGRDRDLVPGAGGQRGARALRQQRAGLGGAGVGVDAERGLGGVGCGIEVDRQRRHGAAGGGRGLEGLGAARAVLVALVLDGGVADQRGRWRRWRRRAGLERLDRAGVGRGEAVPDALVDRAVGDDRRRVARAAGRRGPQRLARSWRCRRRACRCRPRRRRRRRWRPSAWSPGSGRCPASCSRRPTACSRR